MRYKFGFTLIELLVVLAIVALLLSIITPRYIHQTTRAQEVSLKENLTTVRNAIDQYYSDKGFYPISLQELVDQHYLRKVPLDTITNSNNTWKMIYTNDSNKKYILDIKSGALGISEDGTEYASW